MTLTFCDACGVKTHTVERLKKPNPINLADDNDFMDVCHACNAYYHSVVAIAESKAYHCLRETGKEVEKAVQAGTPLGTKHALK